MAENNYFVTSVDSWALVGGQKIPTLAFTCAYSINDLPVAQVYPALGYPYFDARMQQVSLDQVTHGTPIQLYLKLKRDDAVEALVFDGFVNSVSMGEHTIGQFSTCNVVFNCIHRLGKLAQPPPISRIYTPATASNGYVDSITKGAIPSDQADVANLIGGADKTDIFEEKNLAAKILNMLQFIIDKESTDSKNGGYRTDALADQDALTIIKEIKENSKNFPLAITEVGQNPMNGKLGLYFSQFISSNWFTSNIWDMLVNLTVQVDGILIPTCTSAYIAPNMSLVGVESNSVVAKDIFLFNKSEMLDITKVVGVRTIRCIVTADAALGGSTSGSQGSAYTTLFYQYPKATPAESGVSQPSGLYLTAPLPEWAKVLETSFTTSNTAGSTSVKEKQNPAAKEKMAMENPAQKKAPEDQLTKWFEALTKVLYGQRIWARNNLMVKVDPLEAIQSLMKLGAMTKVDMADSNMSPMTQGKSFYGMLGKVSFSCKNGQLDTYLEVGQVRDDTMNGSFAFPKHPLYGYSTLEYPVVPKVE